MNHSMWIRCGIDSYLNLCISSKIILLVPGFGLNIFILASLLSNLCSQQSPIKRNVAAFILGSTICNLAGLALWPLSILWKTHGRWLLGSWLCETMVKVKQVTGSASFHYVSFISFSVYLTVVWSLGQLVDRGSFLALQLLSPFVPVLVKEVCQWALEGHVRHLDPINLTCFSYINDKAMRILLLFKLVVFIPLNLYFYAHILFTIFRSSKQMQRSQRVNKKLAKIFSLMSLLTLTAHIPGGVFSLMTENTVCQEAVKEFLMDMPLLSSPILLLCTNKALQPRCLSLLIHNLDTHCRSICSICSSPNRTKGQGNTGESPTFAPVDRPSDIPSINIMVLNNAQIHPTAQNCLSEELSHIYVSEPSVAMEMRHVNGHLPT